MENIQQIDVTPGQAIDCVVQVGGYGGTGVLKNTRQRSTVTAVKIPTGVTAVGVEISGAGGGGRSTGELSWK